MEKGGGRRDSISGVPGSREIRERHSGDILGRVREGGRSDNSDNKYAGFTNYGARLGRRPAHEKSGALREQDFAHKFARSNTFVSRARRDERIEALGAVCRGAHTPCTHGNGGKGNEKGSGSRGTCKFLCGRFLPWPCHLLLRPTTVFLSVPFLSLSLSRPPLSTGAQPDLNIKGGLNLTYTTLNHVTSIGL